VVHLEIRSGHGDTLPASHGHPFLLAALLYTTFVMASGHTPHPLYHSYTHDSCSVALSSRFVFLSATLMGRPLHCSLYFDGPCSAFFSSGTVNVGMTAPHRPLTNTASRPLCQLRIFYVLLLVPATSGNERRNPGPDASIASNQAKGLDRCV